MKNLKFVLIFFMAGVAASLLPAQQLQGPWMKYERPADAGWNEALLAEAEAFAKKINSAAFMVLYKGNVVVDWGEVERRFMCHSVRKTYLSLLYGKYVDRGVIDIKTTLEDLGLDDVHQLTAKEKKATVEQLLQARSGVYHPAAYETESMKKARPARGSHPPGSFWYYNNWDFNTSRAILEQYSGEDFFEDFKQSVADPVGMEDFRLSDCYYHLEEESSNFPAYPFRMSARDMARVGQLYLQQGRWNDRQLVSADWIKRSTRTYSDNTRSKDRGYAYMIWTEKLNDGKIANYSARGVGNQAIVIYPELDIVMVNRANTYQGESVDQEALNQLMLKIIEAKTRDADPNAALIPLPSRISQTPVFPMTIKEKEQLMGCYELKGRSVIITLDHGKLLANIYQQGSYYLIPQGDDRFLMEDRESVLKISRDGQGRGMTLEIEQ